MEDLLWNIGTAFLILVLLYILAIIISIGVGILQLISMWKLYEKAGEPGWSSIIPVYNFVKMVKIAAGDYKLVWLYLGLFGVYMAVLLIGSVAGDVIEAATDSSSIAGIVSLAAVFIMVIAYLGLFAIAGYISYLFPKAYGKSAVFCVLSIFFSPIMIIIMGFDKSTAYVGPKGIPQNKY